MAAKLRVANGPECVKARNELADMISGKAQVSGDRKRAQQVFVDEHCVPPVQ
jgi:predicted secreted Zn-dependent protease